MRIFLLLLISTCLSVVNAANKRILEKIPADYDYVVSIRIPELFKNEKLSKQMQENDEYKDFLGKMTEKIGLTEEDLISVSIGGIAAQYERMRSWQELSKQEFDTAVYVELAKPLDFEKVKKEFPEIFAGQKEVNGITCVQFKDKNMKDAYLAFLEPDLLMMSSDHQLPMLTKLSIDKSVLAHSEAKRLLTTNGFGGVFSLIHWGEIGEVHPMTPWMKNYTGGSFNLYFEDNQDISLQCTMTFSDLQSIKGASLLINMGMSFMDIKPEFAQFKNMIDFKVFEKNLMLDVKVTETSWNMITKAFEDMTKNRRQRR